MLLRTGNPGAVLEATCFEELAFRSSNVRQLALSRLGKDGGHVEKAPFEDHRSLLELNKFGICCVVGEGVVVVAIEAMSGITM
jgi:hypothetical protein